MLSLNANWPVSLREENYFSPHWFPSLSYKWGTPNFSKPSASNFSNFLRRYNQQSGQYYSKEISKLLYFDLSTYLTHNVTFFLPMNNQETLRITTGNSNTLVTLTFSSTITTTTISSASGMLSINSAPTITVAATRQDANFETRLNATENAIFKLGSSLEKFISRNNPSGKSQASQSMLPNLKFISPLMVRVTVAHVLKN